MTPVTTSLNQSPNDPSPPPWRSRLRLGALLALLGAVALLALWPRAAESGSAAFLRIPDDVAESHLSDLAADAPGSQRAILADGEVDEAAYRAAVDRTLRCLERRLAAHDVGVEVRDPVMSDDGFRLTYSYGIPGDASAAVATGVERDCRERHLDDVEVGYQVSRLNDDRYVDDVAAGFDACLEQAGVDRDETDPRRALLDATARARQSPSFERVVECAARFPSVSSRPLPPEGGR